MNKRDLEAYLHVVQATQPAATIADIEYFVAYCKQRGITPFAEASLIITDYYSKSKKQRVHNATVKEHYSVANRWAQQSGGYRVEIDKSERRPNGDIVHTFGIITNRDYAACAQMCAVVPGMNFRDEVKGYVKTEEAVLTKDEQGRGQPPTGKTWEWKARKRAKEACLLAVFGREPERAREMYAPSLTQSDIAEGARALYGEKREALPAPQDDVRDGELLEDYAADAEEHKAPMSIDVAFSHKTPGGLEFGVLSQEQLSFVIEKAKSDEMREAAILTKAATVEVLPGVGFDEYAGKKLYELPRDALDEMSSVNGELGQAAAILLAAL